MTRQKADLPQKQNFTQTKGSWIHCLIADKKNGGPNVIASSLAAIGAGGNVYAQSFSVAEKQLDESKKHTKSLDKIAENAEILTQKQMGNGNLLVR